MTATVHGPPSESPAPAPPTPGGILPRRKGSGSPGSLYLGAAIAVLFTVVTLVTLVLPIGDPSATDLTARLAAPSGDHLLGTDQLGRDIGVRVLSGFAWSLGIGAVATVMSVVIGTAIGICGGWFTGIIRSIMARVIDIGISFPFLVVAVAIVAVVGRGFLPLAITLGAVAWPTVARVVYAETLSLREREYVTAARLIGVRGGSSIINHLLPALRPNLQVMAAFTFADLLVSESALSFLGMGAPLGDPTWGNMLSDSRSYLVSAPWMMLAPATAIVLAVLAANLLGDGLSAKESDNSKRGAA